MFLKAFGQKGQGSMTSKLTHKNVKIKHRANWT
mgnify:CR=1 FL=1